MTLKVGDKVITDFHKEDKGLIREVTAIVPYPHCQSRVMVTTKSSKGTLHVDAGWYQKLKS